jgi:hypothetical protein
MPGISTYIPETNRVLKEYILSLLFIIIIIIPIIIAIIIIYNWLYCM